MSDPIAAKRIDAGIKRGPRKQIDRRPQAALAQGRDGKLISSYPPELRIEVVQTAYKLLAEGKTTNEIGQQFNVPGSTVRLWLLNDDKAQEARRMMVEQELSRTAEGMRFAEDPLALARAREEGRYWQWIAERRDPQRYGQRLAVTNQEVPSDETKLLMNQAQELLTLFREKVVNPEVPAIEHKPLIDKDG